MRPTDYKEEYIEEVEKYLNECEDEYDEFHKTRGDKSDSYQRLLTVNLPTIEGFALRLDVSEKTIYNWRDKHPKFLQSLSKIKREQKKRLLDSGLSGDYNPTIAKLILSSNHGMVERKDVTTDGEKLQPVLVKFIDGK